MSNVKDYELCKKYPWLPQCKRFLGNLTTRDIGTPRFAEIEERAFERLEQALETGVVSERKIPSAITTDELAFHRENCRSLDTLSAAQSRNVLYQVYDGRVKVVKN